MGVQLPWRYLFLRCKALLGPAGACVSVVALLATTAWSSPVVHRPGTLIVKLDATVNPPRAAGSDALRAAGLDAIQAYVHEVRSIGAAAADAELAAACGLDRYYVVTLREGVGLEAVMTLVPEGARATIRPVMGVRLAGSDTPVAQMGTTPTGGIQSDPIDNVGQQPVNDALFKQQWALRNTGQIVGGNPGMTDADIDAPTAWSLVTNPRPVIVAVLDTGVSLTHPDLVNRLVPGYNAADGDATDPNDLIFSHGTGCAGVIGAEPNNQLGIAGVAGVARIMPIRIFGSFGFGYEDEFVPGLMYAADNGAEVASMSIGYPFYSDLMAAAIEYAHGRDVVLVASTGNVNGQDVQFPALMPQTVAVGATNNQDTLWSNSTRGPGITLVAPGVDIITTWDTQSDRDAYREQTGTSFAAPQVAGIAALVRSVAPQLTNEEVGWVLINSCDDLGPGVWTEEYGYGRINAAAAVARALSLDGNNCRTDVNGDGIFTIDDIEAFVVAFLAGDPITDLVEPFGVIDSDDLSAFVDQVLAGCTG